MTDEPQQPPVPVFVPPGGQPPPGYVPYYPGPAVVPTKKSNGTATASLIVSGGSLATLVFTLGLFAPLTLIASIVGTVLGHNGKAATDRDSEVGQRDEAIAGFWMGIAGIVISVLALAFWVVVVLIMIAADPNSSIDGEWFSESSPDY